MYVSVYLEQLNKFPVAFAAAVVSMLPVIEVPLLTSVAEVVAASARVATILLPLYAAAVVVVVAELMHSVTAVGTMNRVDTAMTAPAAVTRTPVDGDDDAYTKPVDKMD